MSFGVCGHVIHRDYTVYRGSSIPLLLGVGEVQLHRLCFIVWLMSLEIIPCGIMSLERTISGNLSDASANGYFLYHTRAVGFTRLQCKSSVIQNLRECTFLLEDFRTLVLSRMATVPRNVSILHVPRGFVLESLRAALVV